MAPQSEVELFAAIRRDSRAEGLGVRALALKYGVHRRLVREALSSAWPAPRKKLPPRRSRLDPFKAAVDQMLRADLDAPLKQRHTLKRIFDRLVAEWEMEGVSYSTVGDYVRWRRPEIRAEEGRGAAQVFIPQVHQPGAEAEVDFGDVWIMLAGVLTKCYLFTFRLSYSGKSVHRVTVSCGQEAFFEGHAHAFGVREQMTYRGFLAEMLMAECEDRDRRRSERRLTAAGFPRQKWLKDFDFDANPNINPATIHTLATCEWVGKGQPLSLIGDSGTGKSHLLIGLGAEAAMRGYRVRYVLAAKLVNELVEAADERQLTKTIARYGRVDLLCIDEIGFAPLDDTGAQLLFRLVAAAYERRSLGIGSHWPFEQWGRFLPEHTTAVSLLDRLLHHAHVIVTDGDSYRMRQARAKGGNTPNNN